MCKREALHLVYDQDGTTVYPGPQIGRRCSQQQTQGALTS